MRVRTCLKSQDGLTLIELVVVMVVISIALVGVMSVINYTTLHSADPVLRHQAIAIAEAYMEEITLKDFTDPDGIGEGGNRALFDNVADYAGLIDNGVRDQGNNPINELENYRVSVAVADANLGPAGNLAAALQITVTVTDPAGESLNLTGFRTDY